MKGNLEGRLLEIAEKLIKGFHWLSPYMNDMPPKTPLIVLREIGREVEQRQLMGVEIKEIVSEIKKAEKEFIESAVAKSEGPRAAGTFTIPRAIKEGRRYSRVDGKWYFDPPKGEK